MDKKKEKLFRCGYISAYGCKSQCRALSFAALIAPSYLKVQERVDRQCPPPPPKKKTVQRTKTEYLVNIGRGILSYTSSFSRSTTDRVLYLSSLIVVGHPHVLKASSRWRGLSYYSAESKEKGKSLTNLRACEQHLVTGSTHRRNSFLSARSCSFPPDEAALSPADRNGKSAPGHRTAGWRE